MTFVVVRRPQQISEILKLTFISTSDLLVVDGPYLCFINSTYIARKALIGLL